ncbi:MAG: serine peptidase, partial [Rhodoferax sp.]|nr:serine peptidase [Rhodoferax sp.]
MMMLSWERTGFRHWALAAATAAALSLMPLAPASAQLRVLPDFTELVEQVGPSVVNIRTLEKVAARPRLG